MFRIFQTLSIPNHKSWGAREILRECSSPTICHNSGVKCHMSCVMCHVSDVRCQMSGVPCHVSDVTCHMSHVSIFFFGQSGGASQWSVCFQLGLTPSSFETYTICHMRPSSPRVRNVLTSLCPLAQCTVHSTL